MSYTPYDRSWDGSPPKYFNPKVMERKMLNKSDWAELIRNQQVIAERAIQREKEQKILQKMEWNETLNSMLIDKKSQKQAEIQSKLQEQVEYRMKKQDIDMLEAKAKDDRVEVQRLLAEEYAREKLLKEESTKRKGEYEKQMEKRMVEVAIDSLEKEKLMRNQHKNQLSRVIGMSMQEREAQKQKELEQMKQSKEEYNRLVFENVRDRDTKDLNYKMFYKNINEKQVNFQNVYAERVGQAEKLKEKKMEKLVEHGVEEARRRAEEEERKRLLKRQEQIRDTTENVRTKIQEQQEEKLKYKMTYMDKRAEEKIQNQTIEEYNDFLKQSKVRQSSEYRSYLNEQMKENEEKRLKNISQMSEHEKKMQLSHNDHMIPGISSSKYESLVSPQMRKTRQVSFQNTPNMSRYGSTPNLNGSQFLNQNGNSIESPAKKMMTNGLSNSQLTPTVSTKKYEHHNPFINPLPSANQNPYITREFNRGRSTNSRTLLAAGNISVLNSSNLA